MVKDLLIQSNLLFLTLIPPLVLDPDPTPGFSSVSGAIKEYTSKVQNKKECVQQLQERFYSKLLYIMDPKLL